MTRRKLIYGAIYVGVLFVVPSLPLQGLTFVGGIFRGIFDGLKTIDVDWFGIIKNGIKELVFG